MVKILTNKAARLREMLKEPDIRILPGAYDALTAKLVERAGFKAVVLGGYSVAASRLAQPDVGYLSMTEMAQAVKIMDGAVEIPVVADGDTGYGNPLSVRRTMQEYEQAGAAAILFEDQVWPKRCGHMQGKDVISAEEHELKIKAAADARLNPDTIIIARTDARAVLGLDEAIERGRRYLAAGADALFIEAPQDERELDLIGRSFPDTILLANMIEGGKTPILTPEKLKELGFKIVFWPCTSLYVIAKAFAGVLATLANTGTTEECSQQMLSFQEFNELIGLPEYLALEQKYKMQK